MYLPSKFNLRYKDFHKSCNIFAGFWLLGTFTSSIFKTQKEKHEIIQVNAPTFVFTQIICAYFSGLSCFCFVLFFGFYFYFLSFSGATPVECGDSQSSVLIRAAAASLCQGHSNAGPEPCLWPTPQFMAMPDH